MQQGIFPPPSGGFQGATAHRDGLPGPVPAPKAGDQDLFVTGEGRWRAPHGGAVTRAISADLYLTAQSARVQRLAPSSGALAVYLGDASAYSKAGGPVHVIHNDQATHPLSIYGATGVPLAQLRPGQVAICHLTDQSSAAGAWMIVVEDRWTGALFSQRQVLATMAGSDIRLSAATATGKALLSYVRSNGLMVRVLTVAGRNVTAGAEQNLGTLSTVQTGQAVLLSDTTGIMIYRDSTANQVRAWGFSVDLATGVCATVGSTLNLAAQSNDLAISLAAVDGQRAVAQWSRTSADNTLTWCMARFDGAATTAGAASSGSYGSVSTGNAHSIVCLSATKALALYAEWASSFGAVVRPIGLNTTTLATTPGTRYASGTVDYIRAARLDSTYAITLHKLNGSSYALSRIASDVGWASTSTVQVSSSSGGDGPCAILTWGDGAGIYFIIDAMAGAISLVAIEYRINGVFQPVFDRSQMRLLSASGAPTAPSAIQALALSATLGLLVYNDPGNSGYLTAIGIERAS